MNEMKIKIPNGYLIVEKKDEGGKFPGVFIWYSKDGKNKDSIISCTEFEAVSKEIRTETYCRDYEGPCSIIRFEDGMSLI